MAGAQTEVPRKRAILVVDDEPVLAGEISEYLEAEGYQVTQACDGRAALDVYRQAQAGHFAVVLTDLRMPGMSGFALARAIIGPAPHDGAAEVIVVTGQASAVTRAETPDGLYAILQKPVRLSHLAALVGQAHDAVLRRHGAGPPRAMPADPAAT